MESQQEYSKPNYYQDCNYQEEEKYNPEQKQDYQKKDNIKLANNQDQQKQQQQNQQQNQSSQDNKQNDENINQFTCKICLEIASEPVITKCGHLYCWECLYHWGESCKQKGNQITCPACKNVIKLDELTSIYTGTDSNHKSERKIPNRPRAERQEPDPQQNNNNQGGFGGFFFMPGLIGGFNGMGFNFGLGNFGLFNNFNLGFGGNQQGQQQGQGGWVRFLPFIFLALNFLPVFFGSSSNIIYSSYDSSDFDFSYSNSNRNRQSNNRSDYNSNRQNNRSSYRSSQQRFNQNSYSSQSQYNNTVQEYLDNDWFDISIVFGILLILLMFYVIKKVEVNQRRN